MEGVANMTEVQQTTNGQTTLPPDQIEDLKRGLEPFVIMKTERDKLRMDLTEVMSENAQLKTQLKAMQDMLDLANSQAKIRAAEDANRISSYQAERDEAVTAKAVSDARLEAIADLVLTQIRAMSAEKS